MRKWLTILALLAAFAAAPAASAGVSDGGTWGVVTGFSDGTD